MTQAPSVLIVADDLSGAADSAAALAARARTAVLLDADARDVPAADVVAVDTDSRYLPAGEAAAACAAAVRRAAPHTLVYKKIDSTLRGSIGPETAAALSVLSSRGRCGDGETAADAGRRARRCLAVVAPAFPGTGRTVLDGEVLVDGEPLSRRHPQRPPLSEQLKAAGLEVARLSLDVLRGGRPAESLRAWAGEVDAVVVDALTDDDLARTVRACEGTEVLLVGSGGLARHLPLPAATATAAGDAAPEPPTAGAPSPADEAPAGAAAGSPALFCVGSRTGTAHAQRRALLDGVDAVPVPVPPEARSAQGAREVAEAARRAAAALEDRRHAMVFPDPAAPIDPHRAGEVAAALATVAAAGVPVCGTLVATGGETARAVLRAAGVDVLEVAGESEPGVVWMKGPGGLRVVTKAGAFGDSGTMLRVARSLGADGTRAPRTDRGCSPRTDPERPPGTGPERHSPQEGAAARPGRSFSPP